MKSNKCLDEYAQLAIQRHRERPPDPKYLPVIANMVCTVRLLPKGQTFDLRFITQRLINSHLKSFAGMVIEHTDAVNRSTALLFSSGSMVIVSQESHYHAIHTAQRIRLVLETITGKQGVTVFEGFTVQNVVGNSYFGCLIDLKAMCDACPTDCNWEPDNFPGLKLPVYKTPEQRCVCNFKKCQCEIMALIFDRGKVVMTGARSIGEINYVSKRLHDQLPAAFEHQENKPIPRGDRFYKRMAAMMVPSGRTGKNIKKVKKHVLSDKEATEKFFSFIKNKTMTSGKKGDRIWLRKFEHTRGKTLLERLSHRDPNDEVVKVARFLDALDKLRNQHHL
jgi:TATA-box binding protein (TBP) (component of TFIID and TFIIIB)